MVGTHRAYRAYHDYRVPTMRLPFAYHVPKENAQAK